MLKQKPIVFGRMEIPGYIIERVIGEGGMSTVYLATQQSLGRKVALKVMSERFLSDDSFKKRFLKEGQIVAQLHHPKIITIYDTGIHEHHFYISQEYFPGGTLNDEIDEGLDIPRTLFIVKCVADALGYAHARGFVHRDIKPQNILFREDKYRSAVLTDFGIAKATNRELTTALTIAGSFCGSPAYASPEQAKGLELDGRSDLYGLGVVLFQMLTGDVPFSADEPLSIAVRHVTEPIPRLPVKLGGRFQPIIDGCLAKDPENRFENAEQLIQAIKAIEFSSLERPESDKGEINDVATSLDPTLVLTRKDSERNRTHTQRRHEPSPTVSKQTDPLVTTSVTIRKAKMLGYVLVGICSLGGTLWYVTQSWNLAPVMPHGSQQNSHMQDGAEMKLSPADEKFPQLFRTLRNQKNEKEKQKRIRTLLTAAEEHEKAGRLFQPGSENAFTSYRAALDAGSDSALIQPRMEMLLKRQKKLVQRALINEDFPASLNLVEAVLRAKPDDENFFRLREQVRKRQAKAARAAAVAEQHAEWLRVARQYLDNGKLVDPPRDNAYVFFQRVIAADATNMAAIAGIESLIEKLEKQAIQAAEAGEIDESIRLIASGLRIDQDNEKLLDLHEKMERRRTKIKQIEALLAEALQHRRVLRLVKPDGRNAFETYGQVLQLDAGNTAARQGIAQLVRDEERLAINAFDQGRLETSLKRIEAGLSIDPGDRALLALRQRVVQKRDLEAARRRARDKEVARIAEERRRVEEKKAAEERLAAEASAALEQAEHLERQEAHNRLEAIQRATPEVPQTKGAEIKATERADEVPDLVKPNVEPALEQRRTKGHYFPTY